MSLAQRLARLSDMFGSANLPLANRNLFIDGALEQGTGGNPTLGSFTLSAWYGGPGTGGAGTGTSLDIRTNAWAKYLEGGSTFAYVHHQTTASTGKFTDAVWSALPYFMQRLERVQVLAGRSLTLSCKLWADAPVTTPGIVLDQSMGNGGSPSVVPTLRKAVAWPVTTTPKKFSVRLDLPSIQGLTFGTTGGTDFTQAGIYFPPAWTGTIYVAEMQLEYSSPFSSSDINGNGGAPTTFEYRGAQAELARLERMYRILQFGNGACLNGVAANPSQAYSFNIMPGRMRAVPAASIADNGFTFSGSGTWNTGGSVTPISDQNWYLNLAGSGGTANGAGYFSVPSGTARVIFDSRL